MDKIGDLAVSMPVDSHPVFAGQRVHWFITQGLSFVAEQAVPKRLVTEFRRPFRIGEFLRMYLWFKAHRPRTVIFLHNPWWASFAAWLADVPERMGRLSQWHSFLFLNVGIRQSRKLSDRHESDFNFDLVEMGFNRLGYRSSENLAEKKKTYLHLRAPNAAATVAAHKLKPKGYRIVHPGMGGSALNWPAENFQTLITRLTQEMPVVITGTKADLKFLNTISGVKDVPGVVWLVEQLKPFELLDLLSEAKSVVAPSTGVLHLAASLGAPSVGIYSPRTVEHPRRWGPKGPRTEVLVPETNNPDVLNASVMTEITPQMVIDAVHRIE